MNAAQPNPAVGMFTTVRNRPGLIAGVEPWDGGDAGRLHLVHVEYKDHGQPSDERLIWEIEHPYATLLEPNALPETSGSPMTGREFDALLRAVRWSATTPYLLPGKDRKASGNLFTSPLNGNLQVEDYQLIPLLKALQMPRVNLLLADDVGLGKTVEACLILTELLLRRRIQRILILTPAALRSQWKQEELWERFSLCFNAVDKEETHRLKRNFGVDANPWRSYSRIIASYHYLRQEDVLQQFTAASSVPENSPLLPWDLLIVDECHNLMPAPMGEDSDLCKMLREITPLFEHRLFLSATPHNGFTSSFTGLLEMLDPVRFSKTSRMTDAARASKDQIVVRRLKSDINQYTDPPKFCARTPPEPVKLDLSFRELDLAVAFDGLRNGINRAMSLGTDQGALTAGRFAVELFNKRLLSCPMAFAVSWQRVKGGLSRNESASAGDIAHVESQLGRESEDDREREKRTDVAAEETGAWLKGIGNQLVSEIAAVDRALDGLGLDPSIDNLTNQRPSHDARFDALCGLIDDRLRDGSKWKPDERLIVFTEYKTTLDYLVPRLRGKYGDERILEMYGGMNFMERDLRKEQFGERSAPVRILVATDAASEGLNFQRESRYLLHFDCPWNPSKLEQRNGRLDRHGQARDVTIFHFFSDQIEDIKFLTYVFRKAHRIKDDLGSFNEIFSDLLRKKLIEGKETPELDDFENTVQSSGAKDDLKANNSNMQADSLRAAQALEEIRAELDLDPASLRETLSVAMGGRNLECNEETEECRIQDPHLRGWEETIDESVRKPAQGSAAPGALRSIAFSPKPFIERIGGREIFRERPHVLMAHLSHPLMQKALSTLTRRRYPGTASRAPCWIVRLGDMASTADAQILLSLEELAVNELREPFHHWVTTHTFTVRGGKLMEPDKHCPPAKLGAAIPTNDEALIDKARDLADDIEMDIKAFLKEHSRELTDEFRDKLSEDYKVADREAKESYARRNGEISQLVNGNTVASLEREIRELREQKRLGFLFDETKELARIDRGIEEKKAEIARRTERHEEVRRQLEEERKRTIDSLLPKRHRMDGDVYVYPVCLEIRLPR